MNTGFGLLTTSFTWARYSQKLIKRILRPHCVGCFLPNDAGERKMHVALGFDGSIPDGNAIYLYWLVDLEDGVIADAKFQAFGQSALLGAAEAACEILIGKNYDQAARVGADLIDRHLRDRAEIPAFPPETHPHLNLIIGAIDMAADACKGLPLPVAYVAPPAPQDAGEVLEGGFPGWYDLVVEKKLTLIEEVMNRDIRPYIALDAGGVEVLSIQDGKNIHIAYKGSCTSCISSVGATLSYIQQTLRNKLHPDLTVIPEL